MATGDGDPAAASPGAAGDDAKRKQADGLAEEAKGLEAHGDWEKARAVMVQAIDLQPRDARLHALMGWYSYHCPGLAGPERERLAQHHLSYALELDASNHYAHHYMGMFWLRQGNALRARSELVAALASVPDFKLSRDALAGIDGAGPAPAARPARTLRPPVMRRASRAVALGLVTAALVGAYLVMKAGGSRRGALDKIAADLGTNLRIEGASQVPGITYIETGPAWEALSQDDRQREVAKIAEGAARLKLWQVSVFSRGHRVAAIHDGKLCIAPDCPSP